MVKKITAFKDEVTGKIFEYACAAEAAEKKALKKQEELETRNEANRIAKEFGYKDFLDLRIMLSNHIDEITSINVKMRVHALTTRRIDSFGLADVKEGLRPLIQAALDEINKVDYQLQIFLDGKLYKTFESNDSSVFNNELDLTKGYLISTEKTGRSAIKSYASYPNTIVMSLYDALMKARIDRFDLFVEDAKDIIELSDADKYNALVNGGVDNWVDYEYAIDNAEQDGYSWYSLSDEDKFIYLLNAGVDNWSGYSDSLSEAISFDEISKDEIEKLFKDYELEYAKKWDHYQEMKFILHGITQD